MREVPRLRDEKRFKVFVYIVKHDQVVAAADKDRSGLADAVLVDAHAAEMSELAKWINDAGTHVVVDCNGQVRRKKSPMSLQKEPDVSAKSARCLRKKCPMSPQKEPDGSPGQGLCVFDTKRLADTCAPQTGRESLPALAMRPAALHVHYLGFPSTIGATYIDNIIGDATVSPPELVGFYTEKLLMLSTTFQVTSHKTRQAHPAPGHGPCMPRKKIR